MAMMRMEILGSYLSTQKTKKVGAAKSTIGGSQISHPHSQTYCLDLKSLKTGVNADKNEFIYIFFVHIFNYLTYKTLNNNSKFF